MATGTYPLNPLSAIPDPTNSPGLNFTGTTNRPYLAFDGAGAAEACVWTFYMPSNFASSPVIQIIWSSSANPGSPNDVVRWSASVMATTPETDSVANDSDSFDTENAQTDTYLGTTAKRPQRCTVSLANADSLAAGDYVAVQIKRNSADAADTMASDAWLWAAALEYTTT